MGKYKLIVADLDGTLLDDSYRVMPELLVAVNACRAKGVELALATGRLYPSALAFAKDLDVRLPVIASNGAVIRDPLSGELLWHLPLPRALAIEALKLTAGSGAQRFVNIGDILYTDAPAAATKKYAAALRTQFIRSVPLAAAVTEDPTIVVWRDREDEIARLTGFLRGHFGERVYLANSKPFFIDLNHPEVSKGAALLKLCRKTGVSPDEVIAIGDGWNDLEMFKAAGLGAAVANAPAGLREKADYVCAEASYRGVIEVIERFIL